MYSNPYFIRYLMYFILLFLGVGVYLFFLYLKKDKEKTKITILKEFVILITTISYFYILFSPRAKFLYHMTYSKAILLFLSITLLLFSNGLIKNKEKNYKQNINLYIILYMVLLISITMIIGRMDFVIDFSNLETFNLQYQVPFQTIKSYMGSNVLLRTQLYNLLGNFIMLMPLSFLLMLKDKKYNKIRNQIKIILPCVLMIEFFQHLTGTGTFDIDDIILNVSGSLLFAFFITRFHMIDKIRKLFYHDLHLKETFKYILFFLSLMIPILFLLETLYLTITFLF